MFDTRTSNTELHSESNPEPILEPNLQPNPQPNPAYDKIANLLGFSHALLVSPCACCSPVISELNNSMKVSDRVLSDPEHWQKRAAPLAELSVKTQIFINVKIYTVNESFSSEEAMAIKDGKIVALGREDALREDFKDSELIDCKGRTILPGFIEPHMHFLPIATIGQFENVGPFRFPTFDGALDRLKELAEKAEEGEWIMARQFDPSLQEGPDQLTRDMLDEVSTSHAIFVYNASLHFAYCNSRALEIAGIDENTEIEPGSTFGRLENGQPNGVLQGGVAIGMVARHNPAQEDYDLAEACLAVCHQANKVGITTFCDQATGVARGVKELDLYQALADSNRMTARLRYSLMSSLSEKWIENGVQFGDGNALVRASGWKIVSDGSNQGYTGLQREPYLYGDNQYGVAYVEAEDLKAMVRDVSERGWPVVVHANGDKAIDNTLDAFEATVEAGVTLISPCRIEHCSILHDEQIERIHKLGLSPSFLIGHVYYWGKAMRDTIFGEQKARLLDRTASCEASGIRWTLHSDEPVTEMGPLRCIENAVTRKLWREPESQLAPEECIDVQTAIRAMTRDAAWQCHSDHEVGSLDVGKFADFIILDKDPCKVLVDEISEIKVLETWMGGRCVYAATLDGVPL
ncbi:MAG: amidohydrolase [Pseudomonadales bacterium]|nr:amidohydrolase [Pseudomonadales bacterium]